MAKPHRIFIIMSILVLTACSTIQVSQDYLPGTNLTGLKTFAWQPQHEVAGPADDQLMAARIRRATDEALVVKGFRQATRTPPDLYVDYRYSVSRQIESESPRTSIGFGTWGGGYGFGIGTGSSVDTYDEALLFIDIIDPKNGRLLWRGKGTYRLSPHPTPEQTTATIDEVVNKILAQFPPAGF